LSSIFAIDVGGTFTDIVVLDGRTGKVGLAKTPTTPEGPSEGVLRAVDKAGISMPQAAAFFHGTTLGINTVLEHKGARAGLVTSKGCRDVLEIARMNWPMYRLHWDQPPPLIPRPLRQEVNERIRADGLILADFTEDELCTVVDHLLKEGAESIAVCFLHAYAFPENEQRAGAIIERKWPQVEYTLSHLVSREYREYERTATTVVDAMIKPTMGAYIDRLSESLSIEGFCGQFFITRCDGGVMSGAEAKERCIRTLISGPASGVSGGAALARWLGIKNLITIDMGGTSFDAALIIDQEPILKSMTHIEGVPLLMPVIEMATIGAGGGSIAWIDAGGALHVGPQSAGAVPGPVCYGRGGTEPTFTDAAVVSGLLDPGFFLGGEVELDTDAARAGIEEKIAEPLGLSVYDAASGIVTLTEAKMAATLEEITIGKGYDPRDFTLLAYGGGGSLVGSALASRLGVPAVLVPRSPAAFSAWGMLTLDIVHDFSKTFVSQLDKLAPSDLIGTFRQLEADGLRALQREGVSQQERQLLRSVDMRYELQEHTLSVPLPGSLEDLDFADLRRRFDEAHKVAYGYEMPEPVEVVAYRVRAVGSLEKPSRPSVPRGSEDNEHAVKGMRKAVHRESGGEFDWTIYDRELLRAGNVIRGPAIIEEPTATTLVAPSQRAAVDTMGNLLITAEG
jgi:N-methylhydantoinase A